MPKTPVPVEKPHAPLRPIQMQTFLTILPELLKAIAPKVSGEELTLLSMALHLLGADGPEPVVAPEPGAKAVKAAAPIPRVAPEVVDELCHSKDAEDWTSEDLLEFAKKHPARTEAEIAKGDAPAAKVEPVVPAAKA